jgi:hypothetical protein
MIRLRGIACELLLARVTTYGVTPGRGASGRWWKGNNHTDTLWSDGNAAPEQVADWYRSPADATPIASRPLRNERSAGSSQGGPSSSMAGRRPRPVPPSPPLRVPRSFGSPERFRPSDHVLRASCQKVQARSQ